MDQVRIDKKYAAGVALIHIALSEIANMTEPSSSRGKDTGADHMTPEKKFFSGNDRQFAE